MAKITFLLGMGAGYVLGARAGRERYEQIRHKADKAWGNPTVQEKVGEARAKAPEVASAAKSKAGDAASKAGDAVRRDKDNDSVADATGHDTTTAAMSRHDDVDAAGGSPS